MDINSIQKRLTTNTLKWINWFYALIVPIIIGVFISINTFTWPDDMYAYRTVDIFIMVLLSLITFVCLFLTNNAKDKRTQRIWVIALPLVLIAISNVVFWMSYDRCIEEAEIYFSSDEFISDRWEGNNHRSFSDKLNTTLFLCFLPYILTAIIRFVSLSKKHLALHIHTRNEKHMRNMHYFLFFVIYITDILCFLLCSFLFVDILLFLAILPLQVVSLLWRKNKVLFWLLNVIYAIIVAVSIIIDIVYIDNYGDGFVSGFYLLMLFIIWIPYGISVITIINCVINKIPDKHLSFRLEQPKDYREVENLTREAFWNVYRPGCTEHYVLNQYRDNPDFIRELDFVMEKDGKIIGHVMFSKAEINLDDGTRFPSWTFGPISIHPDYKRKGYGLKLLNYALIEAREKGVGLLCMEGNIEFYKHAGFDLASKMKIHYHAEPRESEVPYFLAQEIIPGYWGDREGTYCPPKGYFVADENPEAFEAYDATFPAKEKLTLPGQLGYEEVK